MKNRDEMVLNTLIDITAEVAEALERFQCYSFGQFISDAVVKRAITMCLISMSENVDLLTQEFKNKHDYIDFKAFKALRNIAAHKYGSINFEMVWEIATKNLPKYRADFKRLLDKHLREEGRVG
ncbi:antitoxin [Clostridia bacterium]|nr:antitoxin [Clostridia bacterium]